MQNHTFFRNLPPLLKLREIVLKSDIERFPYFNVLDYHYWT